MLLPNYHPIVLAKNSDFPLVHLKPHQHRRVKSGHPWVYSNEVMIDARTRWLPPGSLVRLVDATNHEIGIATFNPYPLIAARLLTSGMESLDHHWIPIRLQRALSLRERLFEEPYYRWIHAEADGLPGLVVDRYGPVVVAQSNTAGIDRLWPEISNAIWEIAQPRALFLRRDSRARLLEGLQQEVAIIEGDQSATAKTKENGCCFPIDPLYGQKTGWFFDQRDNRAFLAKLCNGKTVLDLYGFTGGFTIQIARYGAESVMMIDRSAAALKLASVAAQANSIDHLVEFHRADGFTSLQSLAKRGRRFDIVIADPPAFAKSRQARPRALKAYRKLAALCARLVAPNGILFLASCSHPVSANDFAREVSKGLILAQRTGRILCTAGAGPDHPVHPFLHESTYLKAITLALD